MYIYRKAHRETEKGGIQTHGDRERRTHNERMNTDTKKHIEKE